MIGKQVLAFGRSVKSEFINIGIFAASLGGCKGRPHIGRFTPDRERSHVCLSPHSFVASLKKMSLKSDFINFFHDLIHIYSLGAGADSPQGTKF